MADTDDFQDFREAVSDHATHDEAGQQMKVARTCLDMGGRSGSGVEHGRTGAAASVRGVGDARACVSRSRRLCARG